MRLLRARWLLALVGLAIAAIALKFGLNRARWRSEELDRLNDVQKHFATRVEECFRVEGASPETCQRQFEIDLERMRERGFFDGVRRGLRAELDLAVAKEAPRYQVRHEPSTEGRGALEQRLLELDRKAGLAAMDELGDRALLVRSIEPGDDAALRFQAMLAARDLGDLASWKRLALIEREDDDVLRALVRGASLCLLGEPEPGLAALTRAEFLARREGKNEPRAARALELCLGARKDAPTPMKRDASRSEAEVKVSSAEAHADVGEWQLALDDARAADAAIVAALPPRDRKVGAMPVERARTLWLLAASSTKLKLAPTADLARYEPDPAGDSMTRQSDSEASIVAIWRAAISGSEQEKRRERVRLLAKPSRGLNECASMFVMSGLAGEKGAIAFLDALDGRDGSSMATERAGATTRAHCRARVARWRRDEPETLRWTRILSTLEGLVPSAAAAELSHDVGL